MKNLLLITMVGIACNVFSQITDAEKIEKICDHAKWQTKQNVIYDGSYRVIKYPWGDVPDTIGVCTDVIIRAYRSIGVDLQVLVHESVKKHHSYYYPNPSPYYGGKGADSNIDHRRVRILKKFLKLHYPTSQLSHKDSYLPGDIVFWDNWHIGIIVDKKIGVSNTYYGVHNIGSGPEFEDFYYDENQLEHFRIVNF